jgi:hypothetical protein
MTHRVLRIAAAFAIGLPVSIAPASVPADVVGRADPDWPCIQRKVPELSMASLWQGPPAEEALTNWRDDAEVGAIVGRVAPRRVPIEEATAAITAFAEGLDAAAKEAKLTALFAGLFQTLDRERSDIMAGIERYARAQKQIAERIRQDQAALSDLRAANPDSPEVATRNDELLASVRVFDDRRNSLTFVCEVPTLIEQRLFALSRAIQNELSR